MILYAAQRESWSRLLAYASRAVKLMAFSFDVARGATVAEFPSSISFVRAEESDAPVPAFDGEAT